MTFLRKLFSKQQLEEKTAVTPLYGVSHSSGTTLQVKEEMLEETNIPSILPGGSERINIRNLPKLRNDQADIKLVPSSSLGSAGPGRGSFQRAIGCCNSRDNEGAIRYFSKALKEGLSTLHQGYAYSNLGVLLFKKNDLNASLACFLTVLEKSEALYESVHDAATYLSIVYSELGRREEADVLGHLVYKTQTQLGYSLSGEVANEIRRAVQNAILGL